MTNVQASIDRLLESEKHLHKLLDEQQYEQFLQQQEIFGNQLKTCVDSYTEEQLLDVIAPLKRLQESLNTLQQRAEGISLDLKEKSLILQRNKKKIKAYK
ncbi:hypothetical protein [Psychromonas sp. 14N.309.X.WAT.B.A12]|jgi:hypothetical protein|uniref:hypothetical protein n=1 Tax=unclassified Psychromonas TaxID=2614957 RepID=UPI0025B026F7|nr:hypothetical protein [Psychromonas sp. 14N.309.X.WAT.B.A12]MDN2662882.1 hypothetical protein [Psychromonas sp. 14N.309.X.WAT.B.A12]